MSSWMKRHAAVVVAGLAVVVSGAVNIGMVVHQSNQDAEHARQIQEARDDRSRARQAVEQAQQEVTAGVFGAHADRVVEDEEHINSLLNTALTWDSHESYVDSRNRLVDDFGLERDAAFMTEFLVSPDEVVTVDGEGNEYYGIDARGLNSSVERIDVSLLGASGTVYRYQVTADISVLGEIGQESARAKRPMLMFIDLDAGGEIVSIEGYATKREMQTSW